MNMDDILCEGEADMYIFFQWKCIATQSDWFDFHRKAALLPLCINCIIVLVYSGQVWCV